MADEAQAPRAQGRSVSPKLILGLILVVLVLVFIFQNTAKSKVDIYFWDATAPRWVWMVVLFVAGLLVGSIFPWLRRRDHRRD